MKIKKIELKNNPFFGNQEFLFTNKNGDVYDNVVLAGENGSGKTQLLNIIFDFCNLFLDGVMSEEIRIITVLLSNDELDYVVKHVNDNVQLINPTGEFVIVQDFTAKSNSWNRIKVSYIRQIDEEHFSKQEVNASWFFSSINKDVLFKSIFSTVEINYNPKETKSVTAKDVDEEITKSIRSGSDIATEIQQLFIDIQSNDASDLSTWVDENDGAVPPANVKNQRINRFKKAFASIFPTLNFYKIVNEEGKKKVLFRNDNAELSIGSLSSGEKQIVFRGAFLLQNKQSSKGCVILIDEPEISLHPIWQGKIFDYYRNLFIDGNGFQTSQIFIATHSQYVLRSGLENLQTTLMLLLGKDSGERKVMPINAPLVLPSVTAAEINYVAFNLISNDYHIELYGYLQSKIARLNGKQECSVWECDNYIVMQPEYNAQMHKKNSSHTDKNGHITSYVTLPTFIRNAINHPDNGNHFTKNELRDSIELLINLCK